MLQANYCGHCTTAKPAFQNFAGKHKSVACLTIQGDDDSNSSDVKKMIDLVIKLKPTFEGFPDYLLFKDGKYVSREIGGRTETALEEFISSI